MSIVCETIHLPDPHTDIAVKCLRIVCGELEVLTIPDRCMDIYSLSYKGVNISCTDRTAGIVDQHYIPEQLESFSRSFFVGMLTTCGLIQAGRPCEEEGRFFGLHGVISHVPVIQYDVKTNGSMCSIIAQAEEHHPEGERIEITRCITVSKNRIEWEDKIVNKGILTPFMMMYHINFGAPFLSPSLQTQAHLLYAEERDTGRTATVTEIFQMDTEAIGKPEKVYYTKPEVRSVYLTEPNLRIAVLLDFHGMDWMGVWKNYQSPRYALGLEPCLCPGLGRVDARKRGLLPLLLPGQMHKCGASLTFE